jgi:hypothetical protein
VRNLLFADAVTLHFILRKVDAILAPVDGDILPEVDQLQAGTDGV